MSKLYVPDGAWLVCSKGMKKQQLKVTSQSTITIADGRLKATINDRPGGNFMCGKMMLAGAIIGAIIMAVVVIGTIATGGALTAVMAAGAAGGAGLGFLTSLIPSICAMLLQGWYPYAENVLTCGQYPLLEDSTIPCKFGGTVMILYSEKAADEFTDVTRWQTGINVVGVIAFSFISGAAIAAIGTTAGATYGIYSTFGSTAALNYLEGVAIAGGTSYATGMVIDHTKETIYSMIPTGDGNHVNDYVNNGFETDPEKIVDGSRIEPQDESEEWYDHTREGGEALGTGQETIGDRTSEYTVTETNMAYRLNDIEEYDKPTTTTNGKIDGAIEGKKPTTTSNNTIVDMESDRSGTYQEIEQTRTTTNAQYELYGFDDKTNTDPVGDSVKNTIKDKKGLIIGLLMDAYKGFSNFILKGQAEDLEKVMKNEEAQARASITVYKNN